MYTPSVYVSAKLIVFKLIFNEPSKTRRGGYQTEKFGLSGES